jgi:hypothetical protein
MANTHTDLPQVSASYAKIHDAIIAALGATSDAALITTLLAEDKAAYDAYRNVMNATLNPGDPIINTMIAQLKTATGIIDTTQDQLEQIEDVATRIGRAVGILAKVASLVMA